MSKRQGEKSEDDVPDLEQLFPGEIVELERGIRAVVFPPGLVHLRRFSSDVVAVAVAVGEHARKPGDIASRLIPYLISNASSMLSECVRIEVPGGLRVKFEELPHWLVPPVLERWVDISFGDEAKLRPWKAAVEKMVEKATGRPFSISEIWSKRSSPQDTPDGTSSTAANLGSPTEAGASRS